MAIKPVTLKDLKEWSRNARIGAVLVYHNSADEHINPKTGERARLPSVREKFDYARDLFEAGRVILFQHRNQDGTWDYCAQRCSHRADAWLDRLSALTETPHNRYAHVQEDSHDGI